MYNATNGPGWHNKINWLTGTSPCGWDGVSCDGGGRVTGLVLPTNNLSGTLPASLSALTNLQNIYLYDNHLSGSIPASLSALASLQTLDLSSNQLSGTIPGGLSALTNLRWLILSSNQLTGTIPGSLGTLTNLQRLGLNVNQLSGTIPGSLGTLTNLGSLSLNGNQLTGTIPASLGALTSLQALSLNGNQLTGTIPASLSALTNLQQLFLNDNQLSGPIPASLGALTKLQYLYLHNNQLSGCYPASLSTLCGIQFKNFSGNTGLPDGGSAAGFSYFCATGLSSNLAVNIAANPSLAITQGQSTQLTAGGADTYRWSTTSTANPITVSVAGPYSVTGTTTAGCSNTATATVTVIDQGTSPDYQALVDLYNATNGPGWTNKTNWLTGTSPCGWFGVTCDGGGRVTNLDLGNNQLSGILPASLSALTNLQYIVFNDNQLSGTIPASMSALTNLRWLILSSNQLTGSIPASLSTLTNLTDLYLFSNQLTGSIPASLSTLTNLQKLYLSYNQLSGCYPASLSAFCGILNKDFSGNAGLPGGGSAAGFAAFCATGLSSNLAVNITANPSLFITQGSSTQLTAGGADTYRWSTTSTANPITVSVAGPYSVTGTTTAGCSNTATATVIAQATSPDYQPLVDLYNATNGPGWTNKTNWLTGSPCGWYGVRCDGNGRVSFLQLPNNQLRGTMPGSLSALTNLNTLDLGVNQLSGTIPASLSALANLEWLDLSSNQLTGPIPVPPKLGSLLLGRNQLSGPIPASLGERALYNLSLVNNQFSGCYPANLSALCGYRSKGFLSGNVGLPDGGSADGFTAFCTTGLSSNLAVGITANPSLAITQGQSTQLTAAGADTYRWSTTSTVNPITVSVAGPYSVTGTTTAGCSNTATATVTVQQVATPIITAGTATGTITACQGIASVSPAVQQVSVSGSNLTASIVATAPAGFEISTASGSGFGASVTLTQSGGSVASTVLYVRSAATATGSISGNVTLTSTGATAQNVAVSGNITTTSPDYQALVDLYNATDGSNWKVKTNWLTGCTPCGWYGVTCDGGGRVTSINLNTNQLGGSLPASLSALTYLKSLTLNQNPISGSIPASLGALANLQYLEIQSNRLSGSLPASLSALANLQSLNLFDNQLSGSIPGSLGALSNLQTLNLANNQLNGSIPASLSALINLQVLQLYNNQLSGSIPGSLSALTNLQNLALSNNQLSGSIPGSLSALTNLQSFGLSNNQLSGNIPNGLGALANLQYLGLQSNQLSGTIPASLSALTNLQNLALSNNQLSGSIPNSLSSLTNLTYLDFDRNQLSGTIPASLSALTKLQYLILQSNQLSGSIPASLGALTNLRTLWLQNNQLSGCYPASLLALRGANSVNFSDNTGLPDGGSAAGLTAFYNSGGLSSNLAVNITANPSLAITQGNSTQLTAAGADTYRWSTNSISNPITVSVGGPYSVTGTTTAGCSNTATTTVIVNAPPCPTYTAALTTTTTTPVCIGTPVTINFTVSNGNAQPTLPYSFTYSNGTSTVAVSAAANTGTLFNVSPAANTTYSLVGVKDAVGCAATTIGVPVSVTITQRPTVASAGSAQFIAPGTYPQLSANTPVVGTGTWTASIPGTFGNATSPVTSFTPADPAALLSGTSYMLTWTISNGVCTPSSSMLIVSVVTVTPLSINLAANPGTIYTNASSTLTATVSGGTPGYTYSFSGPGTITPNGNTATVSGLPAGSYSFTVVARDATLPVSQSISQTVTINVNALPPAALSMQISASPSTILTTGTTTLAVNASGGKPPYSYSFSGPGTIVQNGNIATVSGLPVGVQTFTVTLRDADEVSNQRTSQTVSVTVNAVPVVVSSLSLTASASPTTILTSGTTTLSANASGGTPGYSYSFSGPGTIAQNGNIATVSGLPVGVQTFTVTVRDAGVPSNQQMSQVVSVTVNAVPVVVSSLSLTASANPTTILTSGSTTLSALASGGTPGYSYSFSGPGTIVQSGNIATVSGLPVGVQSFTVVARDATTSANQQVSQVVSVTVNAVPVVVTSLSLTASASPTTILTSGTTTLSATVSGGTLPYSYSFSGPGIISQSGTTTATVSSLSVGVQSFTVTVKDATVPLSQSISQVVSVTVTAVPVVIPPVAGPLSATVLSYNCTTGELILGSTGGNGSTVQYAIPGITGFTANPNQVIPAGVRRDGSEITILIQQGGVAGTPFTFNFQAFCANGGQPTPTAPTTTGVPNQVATVGTVYSLNLTPFFASSNGSLSFAVTGLPAGLSLTSGTISGTPSASGVSTVSIRATDASSLSVSTAFIFTVNPVGTPPPVAGPLSATVLSYNCTTGELILGSTGGNGAAVQYAIPGIVNFTTANTFTLNEGLRRDAVSLTINVQQGGLAGTPFVFNLRAFCQSQAPARFGVAEPGSVLTVTVLSNPASGEAVVEIGGAVGQSLQMQLVDLSGRLVESRSVPVAAAVERQVFALSRASLVLLLQVQGAGQSKTVRIVQE